MTAISARFPGPVTSSAQDALAAGVLVDDFSEDEPFGDSDELEPSEELLLDDSEDDFAESPFWLAPDGFDDDRLSFL